MRREVAGRVEIRTVDTDLVAIAMLNSFDGLDVCLTYKQESLYVNVQALCQAMCAAYGLTVHEVVLAIFSRGTDYVEASLTFFRDWNEYLTCLATNLGAAPAGQLQLCAAVRAPVASAAGVDLRRLHAALGATSASKKRSVLKYSANDGHLSRLAWQLLYSARVPLGGGEGLEPERFGWARHEGRTVRVPTQL
jgi:hypothetical protein